MLLTQAPFAVQPRVFDERFPHFVLYVQDVEAAATAVARCFPRFLRPGRSTRHGRRDAQVVSDQENNHVELHLGPGSTHEYDPRYPDQYNVTTFGENEIPVDISGPAATAQEGGRVVSERSVSG